MTITTGQQAATLRYGTPAEAGMDPERVDRIRERGEAWLAEGFTPSLLLLAARGGVIFLHEAFGTVGEGGAPAGRDTIYPLASMSKPITATAVMMLVEEGKVGLGRAVHDYVPEFEGKGKDDVLVWHLLTHTSGLREQDVAFYASTTGLTVTVPAPGPNEHLGVKQVLYRGLGAPLAFAPGTEMSYCNFNYRLLGELVQRVSGLSLADFLEQRIFAPLGMMDSHGSLPEVEAARLARTASDSPRAVLLRLVDNLPAYGGSGCFATAGDLAIFGQTFLNGGLYGDARILGRATVQQMTRNQIPGISTSFAGRFRPEASWGYGWGISGDEKWAYYDGALRPPETFAHSGAYGGYLWVDPVYDVVGVWLSVTAELEAGYQKHRRDLFQNMVYAALDGGARGLQEAATMTITTGQRAATLRYGTPAEAGMDPERVDRIRERGEAWLAEGFTPSLVLLAARGGVIFLHEAFGTVGEGGAPAGRDTIYPLASISKPIAATAAMMLVEHGRIGLGRAVHDYIPEFEGKGKDDVLVWHLLTHTSGLREQGVAFYASTTGLTVTFHEEALLAGRPAQGSFIACSCPFPHELPFPCG